MKITLYCEEDKLEKIAKAISMEIFSCVTLFRKRPNLLGYKYLEITISYEDYIKCIDNEFFYVE